MAPEPKRFTEKITVAGDQLVTKIKELYQDTSAKRVVLKDSDGRELMTLPLTWGIAGGALALWTAPILTGIAALGGTLARIHLEIERETPRER